MPISLTRRMARAGDVHIGTSGWQYDEWDGTFYPEDLTKSRRLEYFSRTFTSVEVNGCFYSLPRAATVREWADRAPARFRFAVKLWRGVTHYKKLVDCERHLERFFGPMSALPTRSRGPVLVQIPPNLHKDVDRLDAFIDMFRDVTAPSHWRIALEARHASWHDEEVVDLLDDRGVARVVHDMEGVGDVKAPNDASFVYLRRHGPGGDTSRGYTAKQIRKDADDVVAWAGSGRSVFVYYNNDRNAHAPKDAARLRDRVVDRDRQVLAQV